MEMMIMQATRLFRSPPRLPDTEETHDLIRQRIATIPDHSHEEDRVQDPGIVEIASEALARSVEGDYGWKATLLGNTTIDNIGASGTPYLLMDILSPLCDWWEDMAREAILNCPPPENVIYPKRPNRGEMKTAIRDGYDRFDIFTFDDRNVGNLHLPMAFTFNGRANISDTLWPFDPTTLIDLMVEQIQAALGLQPFTDWDGRQIKVKPWGANYVGGRRNWQKLRIFEDWSGRSPTERNVFAKPQLKPTPIWPQTAKHMATNVCNGEDGCEYETKRHSSAPITSGCNLQWRAYSQTVFDVFMEANPDLQFGPRGDCVKKIKHPRHRCPLKSDCTNRTNLLDHPQIARFPDNERFIISQSYCQDALSEYDLESIQEWQKIDPEITWRLAGSHRSWYFPRQTNLMLIGYQRTLDRLDLDYLIPNNNEPVGLQKLEC